MQKVLITGAKGFIGTKLVEKFNSKGYWVEGWDICKNANKFNSIDMKNYTEILEALKGFVPDIIIHCAGSADVSFSVKQPNDDYVSNVTITHNLLFALHELNMDETKVVFLSSAAVYGNPEKLPIVEEMKLKPLSPYALHKVMCEDICSYFINNYKMNIKIARIFSAYGVGLKKQIFWDMHNKMKRTGSLELFGTGNESRDYINIADVVQAIYLIATVNTEQIIFNVANGEEITIKEAVYCYAESNGISKDIISFNGVIREGDPINWRADITRLKELGYVKSVSIQNGINDYCKWLKESEE